MKQKIIVKALLIALLSFVISGVYADGHKKKMMDGKKNMSDATISHKTVTYFTTDSGDEIQGYFAEPKAEGNYPAMILIHEWWGLNESIRAYADAFAEQGYVVLAVDLYNGKVAKEPKEAIGLVQIVQGNEQEAFDNLRSGVQYLTKRDNVDATKVASVGWCFGGTWSYQMALNNVGTHVSVMYYGRFAPDDDLTHMKSTILGHFAEKDRTILIDDVKEFQVRLRNANTDHTIYIYPNQDHGFARNQFTAEPSNEASQLAWERTLEFLKKHL